MSCVFRRSAGDVEIEEAVLRIKHFQVAAHHGARLAQFFPVEAAHAFAQLFADNQVAPRSRTGGKPPGSHTVT